MSTVSSALHVECAASTCAGPMFTAYSWSLDTFVDYAWQDLTKLSIIIIVLLVIEV